MPDADFQKKLRAIVGTAHVQPAGAADTIGGVFARLVVEPVSEQEVGAVLRLAHDEGLAVIPRGGGTKLAWGNPPTGADLVLSTARLTRVVEHAWADQTATVEAGCAVAELQRALARHGQRLAVDVLWPERATIGGILSANDSGALRLRYGGLRDLIIGVTLALADGTLASSGGRVVKNVAGYDLQKLATGALGTLGVITRATFRVHPLPKNTRTLTIRTGDAEEMERVMFAIQDSRLAHAALQTRLANDAAPEANVLLEGTEAGISAQEAQIRELATPRQISEGDATVWAAREQLWEQGDGDALTSTAIAKLAILPSDLATTVGDIARAAESRHARWRLVIQATGIGWLRLEGANGDVSLLLRELRADLERRGGSLVVLHQPPGARPLDAWGGPGDALPVMRALKQQLDPRGVLNPGRFVGGI